jgi:hypothetical protein
MSSLAEPQCPCLKQLVAYIATAKSNGTHVVGGALTLFRVGSYKPLSASGATLVITIAEAPSKVIDGQGKLSSQDNGRAAGEEFMTLKRFDSSWRVEKVTRIS